MNQQDKQQTELEDLTLNQDETVDVKGGAHIDYFLRLKGVEGESTDMGGPVHGGWDFKENIKA